MELLKHSLNEHYLIFSAHYDFKKSKSIGIISINTQDYGQLDILPANTSHIKLENSDDYSQSWGMMPPCSRTKNAKYYYVDTSYISSIGKEDTNKFFPIFPQVVYCDNGSIRSGFAIHRIKSILGSPGSIVLTPHYFNIFCQHMHRLRKANIKQVNLNVQYTYTFNND